MYRGRTLQLNEDGVGFTAEARTLKCTFGRRRRAVVGTASGAIIPEPETPTRPPLGFFHPVID